MDVLDIIKPENQVFCKTKLMTDATFAVLEQYRTEMDALLAQGFTEEELTTM